jgi:hypothetical protein
MSLGSVTLLEPLGRLIHLRRRLLNRRVLVIVGPTVSLALIGNLLVVLRMVLLSGMGIPLLLGHITLVLEVLIVVLRGLVVVNLLIGCHVLVAVHIVGILRLILRRREPFPWLVGLGLGRHVLGVILLMVVLGVVVL